MKMYQMTWTPASLLIPRLRIAYCWGAGLEWIAYTYDGDGASAFGSD